MPYLFATEDRDYSDYASGRVIYNLPGAPAFPIRMASEIFQRARSRMSLERPLSLYDPTCGAAYHLAALGFLHGSAINAILASDVDPRAVELARRNLSLLSLEGLAARRSEISALLAQFGKQSHAEALRSADVLAEQLPTLPPIQTRVFIANALDSAALTQAISGQVVDLIFCDIPYGQLSAWQLPEGTVSAGRSPLWMLLEALRSLLSAHTLVAIAADKGQKIAHESYRRVEHFQVGKRQAVLLQALPSLKTTFKIRSHNTAGRCAPSAQTG